MFATDQTDRLAAPYTLTTGHTADRLAGIVAGGPHLQALLVERFGLTVAAAGEVVITVDQVLTATHRTASYGQDYRTWIACMPEVFLKCLVEMAARAEADEFAVGHAVHVGRQLIAELALALRPF
ncbi:hypothetical protein OH809_24900 [Streptomyces sp. NBC_00873]|uniref:hypothetical protein n=1 Tax=Streptomyces sp. NBC_00873 TaxID=2975852 RepID=UPI003862FE5C|nr:hypothetical protein OH809_24900 [Streptomyces sp. NBC_00873]